MNELENPMLWGVIAVVVVIAMAVFQFVQSRQVKDSHNLNLNSLADSAATDEDISRLLKDGKKIEAIKAYRRLHRVGLKEAKEAVEAME